MQFRITKAFLAGLATIVSSVGTLIVTQDPKLAVIVGPIVGGIVAGLELAEKEAPDATPAS